MSQQQLIAQVMAERELARRNLEYYQRYIFKYHYQRPLVPNWHHGYLAEVLMASIEGNLPRVIINLPPSYGKTEISVRQSVSWALGKNPRKKYAYATYGGELSTAVSVETRSIMGGKSYQQLFPESKLSRDQNQKHDWKTTLDGGLYATSTGGVITGRHFDGIFLDDPLKAMDAQSASARKEAIDFYESSIITRLRNKKHGFIVLIMQRLHVDDLAGYLQSQEDGAEWYVAELKAQDPLPRVYDFGEFHYERAAMEPLFIEYEDEEQLSKTRREMGESKYTAQYLHDPEVSEAGYIKAEWFSEIGEFDIPSQNLYIKIDPAMSQKDSADNRAIVVEGYSIDASEIELKVIMDCWYGTWGMDDFVSYIIDAMMRYPDAKVLLESAGGGLLVDQMLNKEMLRRNAQLKADGRPLIRNSKLVYAPNNKVTKNNKIMAGAIELETGRLKFRRGASGIEQIKSEYLRFDPNKTHNRDDCIDATHSGEEYCHPKRVGGVKKEEGIRRRISNNQTRGKWRF